MGIIYFDNAATSWPKPESMIKAMADFSANVGANPGRSGHRLSVEAGRVIFNTREEAAILLGAEDPLSIVFTQNATEGINIIIRGLLRPGEHVITSGMEHNSVMRPLRAAEREGIELSIVGCSAEGGLSPDDVEKAIRKNTKLIMIAHASNVTGTIMPIADISRIAKEHNILFCVDAAQTAGSVPIDVVRDNIDILVFTGHKSLYGPQGTGGMYIRKGIENMIEPLMAGGTGSRSEYEDQPDFMPDRFEAGTPNAIGLAGLCAGIKYVSGIGVHGVRRREMELTAAFIDGIQSIKNVIIYGSTNMENRIAAISFNIKGMTPSDVSFALDERFSIMSRPGLHCAPAAHKTIGSFPHGTVRFSFGIFNTIEQINTALEAISVLSAESKK